MMFDTAGAQLEVLDELGQAFELLKQMVIKYTQIDGNY